MAAAMEQHLCGAKKFLESVAPLPNFASLQKKQFEMMGQKIQGLKSVSTDQVPGLVDVIQSMKLNEQQQVELQMLLAEKAGGFLEEKSCKARGRMQDFTKAHFYLHQGHWAELLRLTGDSFWQREQLCQKLCKHLALLTLGRPSEPTVALVVALLFHIEWSMHPPSGTDMFDMLGVWKPIVRRNLKKFKREGAEQLFPIEQFRQFGRK